MQREGGALDIKYVGYVEMGQFMGVKMDHDDDDNNKKGTSREPGLKCLTVHRILIIWIPAEIGEHLGLRGAGVPSYNGSQIGGNSAPNRTSFLWVHHIAVAQSSGHTH